jgi:hypothetical protein
MFKLALLYFELVAIFPTGTRCPWTRRKIITPSLSQLVSPTADKLLMPVLAPILPFHRKRKLATSTQKRVCRRFQNDQAESIFFSVLGSFAVCIIPTASHRKLRREKAMWSHQPSLSNPRISFLYCVLKRRFRLMGSKFDRHFWATVINKLRFTATRVIFFSGFRFVLSLLPCAALLQQAFPYPAELEID